ncbi:MAG TPA: pyrimidine dimer DNA glycosylase/endonuclease V [Candidatus Absconditabacterales bacterium]|nr:pyrimidine dimer DNA glycosylase/endonuclease V [Candidatus Absconditabacterales bacterium]
MTRINVIPVSQLWDQHLLAEHREIKRIPNLVKKGKYNLDDQPDHYTLGTGHVKFFYDKLEFLFKRYIELYYECSRRGFNIENYSDAFQDYPNELWNDYTPTRQAIELNKERIQDKYKPNFYKYYGNNI